MGSSGKMRGDWHDGMTWVIRSENHGVECLGDPIKEDVGSVLPLFVCIPFLVGHEVRGVDAVGLRIQFSEFRGWWSKGQGPRWFHWSVSQNDGSIWQSWFCLVVWISVTCLIADEPIMKPPIRVKAISAILIATPHLIRPTPSVHILYAQDLREIREHLVENSRVTHEGKFADHGHGWQSILKGLTSSLLGLRGRGQQRRWWERCFSCFNYSRWAWGENGRQRNLNNLLECSDQFL